MSQRNSKSEPVAQVATLAIFVICFFAGNVAILGQTITRSTGGVNTTKTTTSSNRDARSRRHMPPASRSNRAGSRSSVSEESGQFLALGDSFYDKSKWNAAEAAYKEATKLSSGNSEAWAALGFLYVDQGKLGEAYRIHNKLVGLDSSMAGDLMAEIKKK